MAKTSQVHRDRKRKKLIAKHAEKRAELRKKLKDPNASIEEKIEVQEQFAKLPEVLAENGRAVFLAYHSLEDRRVKRAFREWMRACVCPRELLVCQCGGVPRAFAVVRGALKPSELEVGRNPRARSARMRALRWGGLNGRN